MQQLAILWNGHGARHFVYAIDVGPHDLVAADRYDAGRTHRPHVFTRDPDIQRIRRDAGHATRLFDGLSDGARGLFDVRHDPATKAHGAGAPHPKHTERRRARPIAVHRRDDGGGVGGTDIEGGDDGFGSHGCLAITWSRKRRSSSTARR